MGAAATGRAMNDVGCDIQWRCFTGEWIQLSNEAFKDGLQNIPRVHHHVAITIGVIQRDNS